MSSDNKILDSHFFTPHEFNKESLGGKIIRIILIISSLVLFLLDLFNYYFWYTATKYLGWVPTLGNPNPGDIGRRTIPGVHGDISLEGKVASMYKFSDDTFDYVIILCAINFFLIVLHILILLINKIKSKKFTLLFALISWFMAFHLIMGDFFEWIFD